MRRKRFIGHLIGLGAGGLLATARVSNAAVGGLPAAATHADSSPEWDKLRESLIQSRPIDATPGTVQIIAPLRAPTVRRCR